MYAYALASLGPADLELSILIGTFRTEKKKRYRRCRRISQRRCTPKRGDAPFDWIGGVSGSYLLTSDAVYRSYLARGEMNSVVVEYEASCESDVEYEASCESCSGLGVDVASYGTKRKSKLAPSILCTSIQQDFDPYTAIKVGQALHPGPNTMTLYHQNVQGGGRMKCDTLANKPDGICAYTEFELLEHTVAQARTAFCNYQKEL